jgi:hypothetical protein
MSSTGIDQPGGSPISIYEYTFKLLLFVKIFLKIFQDAFP